MRSRTLELGGRIIDGSNEQEEVIEYFGGDSLFTPFERRRGLPIGNQTSQFFANVYLNPLDHFALRELRPACICGMWTISCCSATIRELRSDGGTDARVSWRVCDLSPHARKFRVYRCARG
jgi:hypothetical protein